jgi:hypothetical protein
MGMGLENRAREQVLGGIGLENRAREQVLCWMEWG